jgi:hypothetical protein
VCSPGKEQEGSKAQVNLELFANVKLSEMVNKLLQVISSAAGTLYIAHRFLLVASQLTSFVRFDAVFS